MSSSFNEAVSRLTSQAEAIGRLAQDTGGFAAVVAAFESRDSDAYRWVLERLEMLPYCELICEWVRIKLCVLRCAEVCGPPPEEEVPSLEQFARAVARLSSNEAVLRRVVDAVARGDAADFASALDKLKLGDFCHLICQWVCTIGYWRVCEVVCRPEPVRVPDPVREIEATGKVIAALLANGDAFAAISKAAVAQNCETLQSTIKDAGFLSECETICRFICIWRRVRVCRQLCTERPPILSGVYAIEEARSFALAARQLAGQPRALGDLLTAVENVDAKTYSVIINRFRLGPYCWQVCAWVISVSCREFCECVCPPPGEVAPLFTKVGCYNVGPPVSDFNANGTTKSGALAFTGTIPLIGLIPDGTAPQQLEYRFTYQNYSGVSPNTNPVVPITGLMVPATQIGTLEFSFWNGTAWEIGSVPYWVNNPGATVAISQQFGPALNVSVDTDTDSEGWIELPAPGTLDNNAPMADGLFTPAGAVGLILLDTTKLTSETFDLTGASLLPELTAGETVPVAALSAKPVFQINFEARVVSTHAPVGSNSLNAIALSNTSYMYIRHPEWPGPPSSAPVTTSPLVLSVDILELDTAGGCARLDDIIHVLYTAYHPYLGSCQVSLQGPDVASMTTPPGGSINLPIQPNQGQVIGTGNGTSTTFTGTLVTPALPGSVRINAGGAVGTDNGAGIISGPGVSSGSIDYASGAFSVSFTAAPASGAPVLVDYNTNDSSGTAGTPFDMTGLPQCGYMVWLKATLNLTDACDGIYGTFSDYIPFCTTSSSPS